MNFHICFPFSDFPFHSNRYYNAVAHAHNGNIRRIMYDTEFKRYSNEVPDSEDICKMPEVLFLRYKRVLEKKKASWIETNCKSLLGSYRVFLVKRPDVYKGSLERQIALFSSAESDPCMIASCTVQINSCDFEEERYVLRGNVETVFLDQTTTITSGMPYCMEVGYVNVGIDGRLRNVEVLQLPLFLDTMDLTAFCYPTSLFQTHAISHFVGDRDVTLLEEALRVTGCKKTLRDIVEEIDWKKIS